MQIEFTPLITEKTVALASSFNKYTFAVSLKANKSEARKQLEKLFGVKVEQVNVTNRLGHEVTFGTARRRTRGFKADRKIMIFDLKKGDSVPGFTI